MHSVYVCIARYIHVYVCTYVCWCFVIHMHCSHCIFPHAPHAHNIVGYELSYDEPVQVKPPLARPNPYETAPYKPDMTVEDYTEEVRLVLD